MANTPTKRLRKLVAREHLKEITDLSLIGVPLTRIIKDKNMDVSRPHLDKLVHLYQLSYIDKVYEEEQLQLITNSLFPPWIEPDPIIQVQPETYKYRGRFPFGYWEKLA